MSLPNGSDPSAKCHWRSLRIWEGPHTQSSTPGTESSAGQREGTSQVPGGVGSPCQGYALTWPRELPACKASGSGELSASLPLNAIAGRCWPCGPGQAVVLSAYHFPLPSDEDRDDHHHDNRQHVLHIAMPGPLPNAFT